MNKKTLLIIGGLGVVAIGTYLFIFNKKCNGVIWNDECLEECPVGSKLSGNSNKCSEGAGLPPLKYR